MEQDNLINYLYRRLKNEHLWFVTKTNNNGSYWQTKPKKYFDLDEYGELKNKSKVEKEINEYLGDGAETISEAVSLFIEDNVIDGSISQTDYLTMDYKDKPVEYSENAVEVKNVEPKYIEPQITGSNKQVESKKLNEEDKAEVLTVNNIKDYITINDNREQWDYPMKDIDEAVENNDYLIVNRADKRVYEVTEDEFNLIRKKLVKKESKLIEMELTKSLEEEIKNLFLKEWNQYVIDNHYDDPEYDYTEEDKIVALECFAEEWITDGHEDYLDAIIENADDLDETEFETDYLDYTKYQEAEAILLNYLEEIVNDWKNKNGNLKLESKKLNEGKGDKEFICPICGKEIEYDYDKKDVESDMYNEYIYYKWKCDKCGSAGEVEYIISNEDDDPEQWDEDQMKFNRHLNIEKKLNEIASRVPGTEIEKKPEIEYEELTLDDIEGSMSEEVRALYEQLGIDIDETWENVQYDMEYGYLKLATINGKRYIVYDDGETQAYCSGRDNNNIPLVFIEDINDLVKSKKQEDIFDDVVNGKAQYGVYDDKDERNIKDRYKEPIYAKRNKIRNFKDDKFTQRSIKDIINKGVTHIDYEKMPNERLQAYKNSKKQEDYFDKMNKLRKDAENKMIDSLKKEFPEAKVSDVIESKYAGDRILLTNNGKRVTIYFMDEQGEDGKPWFMIIKNKTTKDSYSGNIEDVIKYIKTNILVENKKVENVQRRLNEENNKSLNIISDMFKSKDFDSDSKAGQIVMRTSSLFNALSDKGYDVQVAFDNGESTNTILLGQQGGQIKITITDTNTPLRAFTDGSFELTEDNIKTLEDISKEIKTL